MNLQDSFIEGQWAVLSGALGLKPLSRRDPLHSITPRALLDTATCAQLLDQLGPVIGSPGRAVTASLLSKRFAFLATGACLYAMSACDRALLLSLDNCALEYGHNGRVWTSSLPVADQSPQGSGAGLRDEWRERVVQALFAGLLAPLWESLHQASGISRRILWDNTAMRVYSLYEKRMAVIHDPQVQQRVNTDFHWLLNQADPALFGLLYNPLQHFRRSPTPMPDGTSLRFRRTCCFYYQASDPVEYCTACPLLRPKRGAA